MKINGRTINGPNYEYVVIPRRDGDIVFKVTAVLDLQDEFDKIFPFPKPPIKILPGGRETPDYSDNGYQAEMQMRGKAKYAFLVIKALEPSNIEWDTVNLGDPLTYTNWETDFKNAGFTNSEYNLVANGVAIANNLDQAKIDEARERFLLILQEEKDAPSSNPDAHRNTHSGGLANASV